jgi:LysM repeat protein
MNKPTDSKSSSKKYTVKAGETLGGIANRNNTTVDDIMKKNPGLKADQIKIGQTIQI